MLLSSLEKQAGANEFTNGPFLAGRIGNGSTVDPPVRFAVGPRVEKKVRCAQ